MHRELAEAIYKAVLEENEDAVHDAQSENAAYLAILAERRPNWQEVNAPPWVQLAEYLCAVEQVARAAVRMRRASERGGSFIDEYLAALAAVAALPPDVRRRLEE